MTRLLPILLLSYLAGSIPTSVIIGRLFFKKDLRDLGSGNAGGTNAFRVYGWKGGAPTVLVDVGKGMLATLVIARLPAPGSMPLELVQVLAGSAAVAGHIWTVFAGFRGGKGVGTAAGMVASLYPLPLLASAVIFAVVLLSSGIVSLASLTAAAFFPLVLLVLDAAGAIEVPAVLFWFSLPLVALIFFTHRSNIRRLAAGTENRFPRLMVLARLAARVREGLRARPGRGGGATSGP
jgi:glycerol-3-phosphate acyltransferase PlsY